MWAHLQITWPLGFRLDLWPWRMTLDLEHYMWDGQMRLETHFWPGDHDLWPWPSRSTLTLTTMTFNVDPCDPWHQRLLVRWLNETWNNVFFYLVAFDQWPWPWRSMLRSSTLIFWPNFMTLLKLNRCWDMNFFLVTCTDGQVDRHKSMHKAHCSWAQVASKTVCQLWRALW